MKIERMIEAAKGGKGAFQAEAELTRLLAMSAPALAALVKAARELTNNSAQQATNLERIRILKGCVNALPDAWKETP